MTVETDSYFIIVLRYIHQNPLKAGVTEDISGYLWSSYHEYLKTPVLTDIDFALDIFSQDRINALTLFRAYTNEENTDECLDYMEKTNLLDQEVIEYLNTLGIVSISELQRLEKGQRDDTIRKVKEMQALR